MITDSLLIDQLWLYSLLKSIVIYLLRSISYDILLMTSYGIWTRLIKLLVIAYLTSCLSNSLFENVGIFVAYQSRQSLQQQG